MISPSRCDVSTTDVEWYREQAERAGITRWSRPDLVPVRLREETFGSEDYRRAWVYFCQKGHRFTAPDLPTLYDFTSRIWEWIRLSAPASLTGGWP